MENSAMGLLEASLFGLCLGIAAGAAILASVNAAVGLFGRLVREIHSHQA